MRNSGKLAGFVMIGLCCVLAASVVFAAEDRPGRGDRRGAGQDGPGGRRGFDREGMQTRMLEMMKERLAVTDEEWTVLQPRLQEVMTLAESNRGAGMRAMFGRGGRDRGRNEAAPDTNDPVQKASNELQEVLDKEAPSSTEIQNKLLALRGAKEQNKQKLATAQQKLREVLSVKQEAQLVLMGMLD